MKFWKRLVRVVLPLSTYRAKDTELDRLVALKELRPTLLHDIEWVTGFKREARTIACLDHPRIVTIFDVVELEERLFIAMRLVMVPVWMNLLQRKVAYRGYMLSRTSLP